MTDKYNVLGVWITDVELSSPTDGGGALLCPPDVRLSAASSCGAPPIVRTRCRHDWPPQWRRPVVGVVAPPVGATVSPSPVSSYRLVWPPFPPPPWYISMKVCGANRGLIFFAPPPRPYPPALMIQFYQDLL